LQLRVTLDHVPVPVPRQLLVRSDLAFGRLHDVLRGAMGWEDTHMHEFEVGERRIGVGQGDALFADESPADDECKTTLGAALAGVKAFRDCYDFGDDWWRTIQIEAVPPLEGDVPGGGAGRRRGRLPARRPRRSFQMCRTAGDQAPVEESAASRTDRVLRHARYDRLRPGTPAQATATAREGQAEALTATAPP
jgi:hypothetical protein